MNLHVPWLIALLCTACATEGDLSGECASEDETCAVQSRGQNLLQRANVEGTELSDEATSMLNEHLEDFPAPAPGKLQRIQGHALQQNMDKDNDAFFSLVEIMPIYGPEITEDEKKMMKKAFEISDKNHDGRLEASEITAALQLRSEVTSGEVERAMDRILLEKGKPRPRPRPRPSPTTTKTTTTLTTTLTTTSTPECKCSAHSVPGKAGPHCTYLGSYPKPFCYTEPGLCGDGVASSEAGYEESYKACKAVHACCDKIVLSGFPHGKQTHQDGIFTKDSRFIPYDYRNQAGKVLEYERKHWMVKDDHWTTKAGVASGTTSKGCPELVEAGKWYIAIGSEWKRAKLITAQCVQAPPVWVGPTFVVPTLPSGSNMGPPPGYVAKPGSGPCGCKSPNTKLDSCGELCCAKSPYTDPDRSGKYKYKNFDDMCYEEATTVIKFKIPKRYGTQCVDRLFKSTGICRRSGWPKGFDEIPMSTTSNSICVGPIPREIFSGWWSSPIVTVKCQDSALWERAWYSNANAFFEKFDDGSCKYDGSKAYYKGKKTLESCKLECVIWDPCIAFDISHPKTKSGKTTYTCKIYTGQGVNFHTELKAGSFEECYWKKLLSYKGMHVYDSKLVEAKSRWYDGQVGNSYSMGEFRGWAEASMEECVAACAKDDKCFLANVQLNPAWWNGTDARHGFRECYHLLHDKHSNSTNDQRLYAGSKYKGWSFSKKDE